MAELSFCSEQLFFLFSTFFKSHHSQNRSNEKPGQSLSVFLSAIIFLCFCFLVDQCLSEITFIFLFSCCFCLQYYLNLYVCFCFLVVSACNTSFFCFNFIFASLCFCVSLLFIYFVFGYLLV